MEHLLDGGEAGGVAFQLARSAETAFLLIRMPSARTRPHRCDERSGQTSPRRRFAKGRKDCGPEPRQLFDDQHCLPQAKGRRDVTWCRLVG